MNFELSDRAQDLRERLLAFMDERVYPAEPVYLEQLRAAGTPHAHPPIMEELKAEARRRGLWNLFLPDEQPRRRADQHRVRAAGGDHGPDEDRRGGVQLLGARHRQHGGAARVRHGRAAGALAAAAAGRRDPLGLRDDRAGRRQLGRDQHRDADRARRRRVRAQRAQVVDHGRAAPELPHPDRDGQDRPGGAGLPAAVDGARPARHARASRSCAALPVFGYHRPRGPRRAALHGRARAGREHHRRRGHGLPDRPGPARPGPHPPLHAGDRRGRARARADVRPRRRARDLRQARSPTTPTSATGSPRRGSRSRWRGCS